MQTKIILNNLINLLNSSINSSKNLLFLIKRKILKTDEKLLLHYISTHNIRKLQIGCGGNLLDGWLNSDLDPTSNTKYHLNAIWPFPIRNNIFDYIFSEHMIEHISYLEGNHMLEECFRILKPNGKIRMSTPDLAFVINLYSPEKTNLQEEYAKWFYVNFININTANQEIFVINTIMRFFGHKFLYDESTLRESFEKAGFINISRHTIGESNDNQLCGLENESTRPKKLYQLESLVLEGTKP
jgi:predicted SAM-dependent methyltransferase